MHLLTSSDVITAILLKSISSSWTGLASASILDQMCTLMFQIKLSVS